MNNQVRMISKVIGCVFIALILMNPTQTVLAQKQVVLLRGETVKLRLNPGDDFIYRLKNTRAIHSSYVNNIFQDAIYTHSDTVTFQNIDRVYFRHSTFSNRIGSLFLTGGIALFLIDQINNSLVHGNKLSLDSRISIASISMITIGLPMVLIRKKSQRLHFPYRLMMVQRGSPFYRPDPNNDFVSPYIPE